MYCYLNLFIIDNYQTIILAGTEFFSELYHDSWVA